MTAAELLTAIQTASAGPSSVSADGTSVSQRPLSELLELYDRLRGEEAAAGKARGLRFTKLVPPGTV